ncbi:MAG: methionyl-tRNA formyltransferase [Campylobacterota bacterium]|nr:methionyl-tRNA formyltransferase [Campylobacterota bacterium]
MRNIIIATIKEWNISNYFLLKELYSEKYNFHLIINQNELTKQYVDKLNPKYIFFPHWSWIINKTIYKNYDCIVFHMTDLPYGRGGSPMQNLILRGIYDTKISALKVDGGIDSGDIYMKNDFNISKGSAEENFIKLSEIIFNSMIPRFLNEDLVAHKQEGEITSFKRRKEAESNIDSISVKSIDKLYDFIRMLDADTYPKAYLEFDDIKMKFSSVKKENNKLTGTFEVVENG